MKLIQRKLGPLDCLTSLNENENTSQKTATVFLHGAGANMHDLTGLTGFLPSLADKHVYFLDAPFSALPGSNMRLWFDVEELLFLMQSGKLKERFENGALNTINYFQAQQLFETAQSELIKAKYDYIFKIKVLEFYFGIPDFSL